MKVTVENKKNLEKNLKVFVDKTTINKELELRYEQIKKDVVLKGFRPGKVPTDIIKKQFGKAVYGEVIDKILKESSAKAIDEKKIRPAIQPKIDLKSFGEGKDLEYTISVTEFPEVKLDSIEKIKFDDYEIKNTLRDTDNASINLLPEKVEIEELKNIEDDKDQNSRDFDDPAIKKILKQIETLKEEIEIRRKSIMELKNN